MGRHIQFEDATLDEFRDQARLNVEALNHATADIDPDRFATAAGLMSVDPDIAWAKFDAMAEGARLAERAL